MRSILILFVTFSDEEANSPFAKRSKKRNKLINVESLGKALVEVMMEYESLGHEFREARAKFNTEFEKAEQQFNDRLEKQKKRMAQCLQKYVVNVDDCDRDQRQCER